MKKHLIAMLLVVAMCLSALYGCAGLGALEKDVEVTLSMDGQTWGTYTVNTFNNAVVPVPDPPQGKVFYGWTADSDWQNKDAASIAVTANKGLIRYDDVKDEAKDGKITLYAVFIDAPKRDLVVAWYDKETTSGLNQTVMDTFTTELNAYLTEQGKTPADMDIDVRGYQGDVGTTCSAIKNDGDVDIMIGWSGKSNLNDKGGWVAGQDFLASYGGITLTNAAKARYAQRITDTELCKLVYAWILDTYAGEGGASKDYDVADENNPDPDPNPDPNPDDPDPITETTLKVSVWNKNFTWISEEQLNNLKKDFNDYLVTLGVDVSNLSITWVVETATGVADLGASVKAAGDVDFIVGCGANVESTGGLTNLTKKQVMASPYMAAERYVALLHKDNPNQLAKALYEFMTGETYPANA